VWQRSKLAVYWAPEIDAWPHKEIATGTLEMLET